MERDLQLPKQKEGVRQWYNRTTGKWRRILVVSTIVALLVGVVFYVLAPLSLLTRIQTYNGAWTIPISALIWIVAFIYIFLIPSREVGFRSQEWVEVAVEILQKAIRDEITPAAQIWTRIGTRVEEELPKLLAEIRNGIDLAKTSAARIEEAVKKNETIAADAKPVVEALKRIEDRFEQEIKAGLIDDIRQAAHAVKDFAGPGAVKKVPASDQPNLGRALQALERKR